jgi:sugar lactone lactonase YvrE
MSSMRVVLSGLTFGESPRWMPDGRLWVADWGTQEIVSIDPAGQREVEVKLRFPSFQPICFDALPDGDVVIVSSSEKRLLRRSAHDRGTLTTYADLSQIPGPGFNEIVVDGRGNAYVNGAGFNLMAGEPFKPGVIALVSPDGSSRVVATDIAFPNGMAVTPDNATLIVADSYGKHLLGFDIGDDGTLSRRRVWADLGDGVPDGICLDAEGAVWYADVPNKRCTRVAEGGDVLQRVETQLGCFACMLGGDDGRTLFMVVREWRGLQSAADPTPSGEVLSLRVTTRRSSAARGGRR